MFRLYRRFDLYCSSSLFLLIVGFLQIATPNKYCSISLTSIFLFSRLIRSSSRCRFPARQCKLDCGISLILFLRSARDRASRLSFFAVSNDLRSFRVARPAPRSLGRSKEETLLRSRRSGISGRHMISLSRERWCRYALQRNDKRRRRGTFHPRRPQICFVRCNDSETSLFS